MSAFRYPAGGNSRSTRDMATANPIQHEAHGKALSLNLDSSIYGTLAEIGAGQEVARWFLAVGGEARHSENGVDQRKPELARSIFGPGEVEA